MATKAYSGEGPRHESRSVIHIWSERGYACLKNVCSSMEYIEVSNLEKCLIGNILGFGANESGIVLHLSLLKIS